MRSERRERLGGRILGAVRAPLIERYLFSQLLWPTLLALAALAGLGVISQSLSALGVLVNDRQSLAVFAKVALLAMPQLLVLLVPAAILIAALAALARLQGEHEITICASSGLSRRALIAPALRLSLLAGLLTLALSLWVQPYCFRILRQTLAEVRSDLAATMVRPGRFTHPAPGVTVYASRIDADGTIHDLFIDLIDPKGRDVTLTARLGRLETRQGAPMLVLKDGSNEELSPAGVLNDLSFDEYPFDLKPILALGGPVRYKLSDRYPHELFFPDLSDRWNRTNRLKLLAEGHARFAAPLYAPAFMLIALAAILGGPFRRTGYGGRIAVAAAAALLARTLGFAAEAAAGGAAALNLLQYLVPLATAVLAFAALFAAPRRAGVPAARAKAARALPVRRAA